MDQSCISLLSLINSISDVNETTVSDDGVSQDVVIKTGLVRKQKDSIKNPIKLTPRRSFAEIEQVSSEFIFRIQKGSNGIRFGLFDGDGGAWRIEAMSRIKSWLNDRLNEDKKTSWVIIG
ncbi:MAG: hypothetical protein HS129_04835 [Leptospiraceae bacterium]|nr:hypothetical protein [Leptospiraceae bacterium]